MKHKNIKINEKDIKILNKVKRFLNSPDGEIDDIDVDAFNKTMRWINKQFEDTEWDRIPKKFSYDDLASKANKFPNNFKKANRQIPEMLIDKEFENLEKRVRNIARGPWKEARQEHKKDVNEELKIGFINSAKDTLVGIINRLLDEKIKANSKEKEKAQYYSNLKKIVKIIDENKNNENEILSIGTFLVNLLKDKIGK